MSYRILDHATDLIVDVTAPTLEAAFEAAGRAVIDATIDAGSVTESERRTITAKGKNLDYLLYSWLEELIYTLITSGFAIRRLDIRMTEGPEHTIEATCFGEPLDLERHGFKVEIKAPTFYEMQICCDGPVHMRFLLDL